jgi:hypothetical protein
MHRATDPKGIPVHFFPVVFNLGGLFAYQITSELQYGLLDGERPAFHHGL